MTQLAIISEKLYTLDVARKVVVPRKGMMITEEKVEVVEFELSNGCSCEEYDEDTDTSTPATYCYGCFDDDVANLKAELFEPWLVATGWELDTPIRIQGSGMGWRGQSGYADTTPEKLIDALGLNTEWILRFKFDGADLTCVRYSHDEPMGTGEFVFIEMKGCDKCGDLINADTHAEELGMCVECSHDYFEDKGD
jgi:hypothetical protein